MSDLTYPFAPKSTRFLKRGQFWAIPLNDGRFGAGCVVGYHTSASASERSSRMFVAGVLHWVGSHEPVANDLEGCPLVEFAFAHLKVITESGGLILGEADLSLSVAPTTAEALSLRTWGYRVPKLVAERRAKVPANPSVKGTSCGKPQAAPYVER